MKASSSETGRQIVHIAMGGFALLLPILTWRQAAALAAGALLFNIAVLPHIGGRAFYRPVDHARGYPPGILFYPAAVLLLILVFPRRPDIVAASWGILAFGDGVATLAGRRFHSAPLPWNREKTVLGTTAFFIAGTAAALLLAGWSASALPAPPPLLYLWAAPPAAALAAAFVETIPVRLDDNLSVPATAAAVLWILSLVARDAWTASAHDVARYVLPAVAVNAVAAWAGWRVRTVTAGGAIAGGLIGTAVFAGAGWQGWALLLVAFLAAAATSRLGLTHKALLGIAEPRGGRRGTGNAFANTGVAAISAILAVTTPHRGAALLALAAALVAGASDTVASEIGKAWGRRTVLVTTFARVPPGTSGAISLEGTAAGLAAALLLAALAFALNLVAAPVVAFIVVAATLSSVVESALGATLEGPGILNNDLLNFLNTASAAGLALLLSRATT
jgi:uncharacterized protein (TIGR00297 family)